MQQKYPIWIVFGYTFASVSFHAHIISFHARIWLVIDFRDMFFVIWEEEREQHKGWGGLKIVLPLFFAINGQYSES